MRDLLDRPRTIESRQRVLGTEYATVIRAIVARAGGVSQAATLLGLDPKTVRASGPAPPPSLRDDRRETT